MKKAKKPKKPTEEMIAVTIYLPVKDWIGYGKPHWMVANGKTMLLSTCSGTGLTLDQAFADFMEWRK